MESKSPATTLRKVTPIVNWTGSKTNIRVKRLFRITNDRDWIKLWQTHKGTLGFKKYDRYFNPEQIPEIDFDNYMVVGIFMGSSVNSAGVKVYSLTYKSNQILMRIQHKSYQTAGPKGPHATVPFGLFVVPLSPQPLQIELDTRTLIRQPPVWTHFHTFKKMTK